jgi:hypothetical protein
LAGSSLGVELLKYRKDMRKLANILQPKQSWRINVPKYQRNLIIYAQIQHLTIAYPDSVIVLPELEK